jgi:hypothetical protein
MEEMGFKGDFLEITKMIYNNITSQVEINGARTEHISITRGVRQGCPFSMLLFVLATVPLIEMINDNKKIKGYKTKRNNIIKIQSYADDDTIIIKNPNEIKEIMQVYARHAKASEAKINEEKTQIFPIGNNNDNRAELAFREKIQDKVKILGATFCTTKEEETRENLKRAQNLLDRMEKSYYASSLMGKILRLHTYVYSLIYSNAWMIDTKSKDFTNFMGKVGRFLCRTKSRKVLEKVSKKREEGGLNFINLKERLQSIKIRDILEANSNIPETDNLIYMCGTKQTKIFGKNFSGPKEELANPSFKELLDKIEHHIETIKNFKKCHKLKTIKAKAIQAIIYRKDKVPYYKGIFGSENPWFISTNYQMLHGLLPIYSNSNRPCSFCKVQTEGIVHMLLECTYLSPIRQKIKQWLQIIGNQHFNYTYIVEMREVENKLENMIISTYKHSIEKYRLIATNHPVTKQETILKRIDTDVRDYIHIAMKY